MNETFVPPKPNEFDKTFLISFLILSLGTRFIPSQLSDRFSKFRVGGAIPSLIDKIEKIASMAPDAPRRWPVEDFVDDIKRSFVSFENKFLPN